jgi:hypothetical protein
MILFNVLVDKVVVTNEWADYLQLARQLQRQNIRFLNVKKTNIDFFLI